MANRVEKEVKYRGQMYSELVTDLAIARKGQERDRIKLWRREREKSEVQLNRGSGIQPERRDAVVKSLAQSASFWRYLRAI